MCPVCNTQTAYISDDEPDENWAANILRFKENQETDSSPVEEIPTLDGAKVTLDHDQYFIHTWDVVAGGIGHRLQDTDLVRVGKQVFEILSYSYEDRRYLVQPFSTELTEEDLSKLAGP
jgi:hypothetical protein